MENEMSNAVAPKSDQLNVDDFLPGETRTIKITKVVNRGGSDQPVSVFFDGDNGKPWKPCKSMCRVIAQVWGGQLANYKEKSLTLYVDPTVKFGGMTVGGLRISAMSGIDADTTIMLTTKRGIRTPFVIHPLKIAEIKPVPAPDKVKAGTDKLIETLKSHANPVEYIQTIAIAKQMAYLTEHRPELLKQVMDSLLLIDRLIYQVVNAPSLDALTEIMTLPDCEALDADDAKKLSDAYAARCTELGA